MLDFLKQRKVIIIIVVVIIGFIVWKLYNKSESFSSEEALISDKNTLSESKNEEEEDMIIVHITGEVKKPGVVKIKQGSRIEDVISSAGGLTENADISNVNLAYIVEDGVKIKIPSVNEDDNTDEYISSDSGKNVIISDEKKEKANTIIVNINTAPQTELEQLPGIGASIATRIIDYRNKNGKFKAIEDIKNVTGIGENKYEKIKDLIKVK